MNFSTGLVMAAWLAFALGQAQEVKPVASETSGPKTEPSAKSTTTSQGTFNDAEYKIGPQDILRVDVWKEAEVSRAVPVRPDGKISLPLLNDVQAAGLTPMKLAAVIADGLTKYINNPQVTVTVSEVNSRRIYVTGEVSRAGAFPLLPNMTVLQALSSSGGFTQFAKLKNIYVLRTEDGEQVKIPFNYKEAVKGKKPEQNILLQPGDVIVVP
jgi:polysaccharide export outer membrane protein